MSEEQPVSAASTSARRPLEPQKEAWWKETLRAWGPVVVAVLLIRTFIFTPYRIPSGSMVPTLLIGDHVFVTKFSYGVWLPWTEIELVDLGDPARGDVIVFRPPHIAQDYIKRVVAVPGDRIRVVNGRIVLNGEEQRQRYVGTYPFIDRDCGVVTTKGYVETFEGREHDVLASMMGGALRNTEEILVPPGKVFVMGDNRDNSLDSRAWGFVDYHRIQGKAHFVWLSWDGCAGRFRTERVFLPLDSQTSLSATPAP